MKCKAELVAQVRQFSWKGPNTPEKDQDVMVSNIQALANIAPRNAIEGMLAVQMIAAHNAAMQNYNFALNGGLSLERRSDLLNQAQKLSRAFSSGPKR